MFNHLDHRLLALVVLLFFALDVVQAQTPRLRWFELEQRRCDNKWTCHECIQTDRCAWCMQPDQDVAEPRCFQNSHTNKCPPIYTLNPDNQQEIIMNHPLTRGLNVTEKTVQISPQRVGLQLRANQVHSLNFQYLEALDFPVDVYLLMNLLNSEENKDNMLALGDELSEKMHSVTTNLRLGFGFIEKKDTSTPYSFNNAMALSTDTNRFSSEVKKASVFNNSDVAEGSFDAIVQAIVCRQQIGWRENARRFLVFATDAGFHTAWGVSTPNDGECHLSSHGMYTHSTIQDYPSISQINDKVMQNAVNVIFAVTADQYSTYKKLSRHIEASSIGLLSQDSSNVVELVREDYKKISSAIEMKDNATSHVKITYNSACFNGYGSICYGLKVGDVVNFTAEISVISCPQDPHEWNQHIQIYPKGTNERLIIDLEMLCSCPCESPGSVGYEENSPHCKNHGTLNCGICQCNRDYYGPNCDCSDDLGFSDPACRPDNTTSVSCSGRGTCLCGACFCDIRSDIEERISGKFCECDNFSCERQNGLLCSGHGRCECGICVCNPGWKGWACDFSMQNIII